jgi:hypothetical protein
VAVDGFVAPLLVLACLLLLFGVLIGGFVARRHLLARGVGTFDCSLRRDLRPAGGWMLGVARYQADRLEWFRIFTFDPRPGRIFQRARLLVLERRQPSESEIHSIMPGSVIVRCRHDRTILELAMTESAYTGFSTWIESAPPGMNAVSP